MRRSLIPLLIVASTSLASASWAQEPPLPTPKTHPKFSLNGPQEAEPQDRTGSLRKLFGVYLDEKYKKNVLKELANKNSRYANQLAGAAPPAGMPVWESIGPNTSQYSFNGVPIDGVDSGRIRTILPDPRNPDNLYVLTSGGGLWRTDNFQQRKPDWKVTTDALISTSGGSAALGRNFRTVYLGIGDPFDVLATVAGVMTKTSDGGRTWGAYANLDGATAVRDVKVDTTGATDVVLVATDVGLFRSADGGATYALNAVGQATGQTSAWSLQQTSAGWLLSAQVTTATSRAGALFISSDKGATWSAIPNIGNGFSGVGRATLAAAAPGDKTVYAIAADDQDTTQKDLFRSNDGGLSWLALGITDKVPTNPNCFQPKMDLLRGQAFYNQLLLVSPSDEARNTVYVGGQLSNAKTTDGGKTWTLVSSWLPTGCDNVEPTLPYVHADSHAAVAMVNGRTEEIIFGTDGGIFVSQNGGKTFSSSKNKGIVSLLTQTIIGTPRREDSAISGLQDNGTRARFKGSDTWNQVLGGDGEGVGWSQANNAVTLATFPDSGIAVRSGLPANTGSPGADWVDATTGINFTDLDCLPFRTPIATPTGRADPTGLVFYTATGSRLYKTVDGAKTWQQLVQFGTLTAPTCLIRRTWHVIGLHPSDPKKIAIGGAAGRVLVSTDGGSAWASKVLTGLVPGWQGFNSVTAWNDVGTLFVGSESPLPASTRFAKSTDNGVTWTAPANAGLPDVAVSDLVVDPHDRTGNTLYAGTWIGVYVTRDGGANWTLFGAGLPNVSVTGLYISPTERFLRVAAYGRGVWEIELDRRY